MSLVPMPNDRPARVKVKARTGLPLKVPNVTEFLQINPQNIDVIVARILNAGGLTAVAVVGGVLVQSTAPTFPFPANSVVLPMRFYFAISCSVEGISEIHAYPWELLLKHYEILE